MPPAALKAGAGAEQRCGGASGGARRSGAALRAERWAEPLITLQKGSRGAGSQENSGAAGFKAQTRSVARLAVELSEAASLNPPLKPEIQAQAESCTTS
ncbi:hypothetical protein AOLI_G00139640 [Acnodon oligacanthus]